MLLGMKMVDCCRFLLVLAGVMIVLPVLPQALKSETYQSPLLKLGPGSVVNKYFYGIDFPSGHIAIKDFRAELIDQNGTSVPLHKAYLHHWTFTKIYQRKGSNVTEINSDTPETQDYIFAKISGLCQEITLDFFFGVGAETRGTKYNFPDPYGIEMGNHADIPVGFEEKWLLNVHAIDTRGVADTLGCIECRCDVYNATVDSDGNPLPAGYKGGLRCCHDQYQCRLRRGFEAEEIHLYLKYTVTWVEWDSSLLPLKVFVLDLTDSGKRSSDMNVGCQVEHQVEACNRANLVGNKCINNNRTRLTMTTGGYLIFGVAHQHVGGMGSALYGQDGRVLCLSTPTYGNGTVVGNERGYLVGMSSCYPTPGSVKIMENEVVVLESNYSTTKSHSGVMSLFYIVLADKLPGEASPRETGVYTAGISA